MTSLRETALIKYCGLSNKLYFSVYQWLWYSSRKKRKWFCCLSLLFLFWFRVASRTTCWNPHICSFLPFTHLSFVALVFGRVQDSNLGFLSFCVGLYDAPRMRFRSYTWGGNAVWLQNPTRRHLMFPAPSCRVWLSWFRNGVCQLAPLWGCFFL